MVLCLSEYFPKVKTVNKTTIDKIKSSALYLEELLSWEAELLKIGRFIAEPSHKRSLSALTRFLNQETPTKLDQPLQMGYEILKLLKKTALTDEEIAAKVGRNIQSIRQAIGALKSGGIEFQETASGKFQPIGRPRQVRGAR
jgi:biotin operon repressor